MTIPQALCVLTVALCMVVWAGWMVWIGEAERP